MLFVRNVSSKNSHAALEDPPSPQQHCKVDVFKKRSVIDVPAEAVFQWHKRPGAFTRLTPPWEQLRLISQTGGIRDGARVELEV